MESLKTTLFKTTYEAYCEYMKLKARGVSDEGCGIEHTQFCTLYYVIDEAGLADEYQEWKAGKTDEQH